MITNEQDVLDRLDTLIALQVYAHKEELQEKFQQISDSVAEEILSRTDDWKNSGELKEEVSGSTKKSEGTVKNRIKELREWYFLVQKKEGRRVFYKKSPLVQFVE